MPFTEIAGHRRLLALLARSGSRRTLPPSLIFAGPAGVGKRLTATAMAQLLNCTSLRETLAPLAASAGKPVGEPLASASGEPLPFDACGKCRACTRIARGIHSDVLVVEPGDSGSIKIEQIRDVVDRCSYRPFEGRCRIVIVDDADAMAAPAQSALLKTLEEPPPSSVFVLVTSHPDLLLATVRSRCQLLRFGQVAARPAELPEDRETAQQALFSAAARGDQRGRLEGAKALVGQTGAGAAIERERLAEHLRTMASLVRDAELISSRADRSALANPDLSPALERLAQTYRGGRGVRAFTAIDRALAALDRNVGVKVVADWVMLQL